MMARKQMQDQPSRVNELWEELMKEYAGRENDLELEFIDRLPDADNGVKDEFVRLPYATPAPAEECVW